MCHIHTLMPSALGHLHIIVISDSIATHAQNKQIISKNLWQLYKNNTLTAAAFFDEVSNLWSYIIFPLWEYIVSIYSGGQND